jgi:hypothetical protein
MELRERATLDGGGGSGRPTPKFIAALRDLQDALRRSPTPCETCATGLAAVVRMTGQQVTVTCRRCAGEYRAAAPLQRRQIRNDRAGGRR